MNSKIFFIICFGTLLNPLKFEIVFFYSNPLPLFIALKGVLASWFVASGAVVKADEVVGSIETDKVRILNKPYRIVWYSIVSCSIVYYNIV